MLDPIQPDPRAADTGGVGLSANSFADVYVEHMPELTRYCRSILRDPSDAEDAAQNAMERAMKALADGPAPERMRPWLFTIAQREAVNVLRLRRRVTPTELDESSLGPEGSAEELAAVRARLAELLADVRELAPRQREVLVARELGGRSYRQIAASLGTTEAAAQQLVLEARQSLRQFEAGRSLECGDVQSWISAHDHARVRTRRVRAHLRSCSGCRGFQHGIAARRRDFGMLLPGVGAGGAWWSWPAGLVGHGAAKLAAAGAVAAIVAGPPLLERHPALLAADPPPRLTAGMPQTDARPALLKEIAFGLPAQRAQTDPARPRRAIAPGVRARAAHPGSATARPRSSATVAPAAVTEPQRAGKPAPDRSQPAATAAPAQAAPAPAQQPQPAATPQALEPVADAIAPVTDAVEQTVDTLAEHVPRTLDATALLP